MQEMIVPTRMTFKHPDQLFLGRLEVEICVEDVQEYKKELYGLAKDSLIELPEFTNEKVPYRMGKILKKAPDSFGERFKARYGDDCSPPEIGDTVMFIPMQSYKLDPAGKYHIIGDDHIIAFYKNKDTNKDKGE